MPFIPNEIILKITKCFQGDLLVDGLIREFNDPEMLKTLRLVDSTFSVFATELLFNTVALPGSAEDCSEMMLQLVGSPNNLLRRTTGLKIPATIIVPRSKLEEVWKRGGDDFLEPKQWEEEMFMPFMRFLWRCPGVSRMYLGDIENSPGFYLLKMNLMESFFKMVSKAIGRMPWTFNVVNLNVVVQQPSVLWMFFRPRLLKSIETFQVFLKSKAVPNFDRRRATAKLLKKDLAWLGTELTDAKSLRLLGFHCSGWASRRFNCHPVGVLPMANIGQTLKILRIELCNIHGGEFIGFLFATPVLAVSSMRMVKLKDDVMKWSDIFNALKMRPSIEAYHPDRVYYGADLRESYQAGWFNYPCKVPIVTRHQEDVDALKVLIKYLLGKMNTAEEHKSLMRPLIAPECLRVFDGSTLVREG